MLAEGWPKVLIEGCKGQPISHTQRCDLSVTYIKKVLIDDDIAEDLEESTPKT